ncbi:hypothetical protein KXD93_14165 [Mucilaginibacter sp. BJC16-A38]|uniref:hypothetical protein n=1 Tax=Mucilaginibacter phenanthrenivorans TaxID=1234842 RepID=UPI0021573D60|nr:hypothetical protein [Mucilaginibacter phenanthrenivorans]MCR8558799.1 hypothetical protein [Mucilaginibacter phenanthrenivorans]
MKKLSKIEMKQVKGGHAGYIFNCYIGTTPTSICADTPKDIYATCYDPDNPPQITNCTQTAATCNYTAIYCP